SVCAVALDPRRARAVAQRHAQTVIGESAEPRETFHMVFGWSTGRRKNEAAVPVSEVGLAEQLLDAVIAGLPDAALVLDRETRVLAFNAAARGIAPALARGESASLALRVPEVVEAVRAVAAGNEPRSVEFSQRVPVDRWFAAHIKPL